MQFMDHKDIRILKLLEVIDENNCQSQRQIACQLNISLGLANSFVKRLVQKGFLKVTTIPGNRLKYILTTKGVAEKTRLSYEYIRLSFRFYRDIREKLKIIYSDFELEGIREIAFYGVGELSEIAYISLQETTVRLVTVFDDLQINKKFFGQEVKGLNVLSDSNFDKILVTIPEKVQQCIAKILQAGVPEDKIAFIN